MDVVEVSCYIKEGDEENTFILKPRTNLDKSTLHVFLDERGRFVNVRLMNRAQSKTYDQTKTFWALANILFQVTFFYKPNSKELDQFYRSTIIPEYFPIEKLSYDETRMISKSWSDLTKEEGVEVIQKIIYELADSMSMPADIQADCKDIFEWLQQEKGALELDPCDFGPDGKPYSLSDWADRNPVCMVTGQTGGDVCHIVSRGEARGFEWLVNVSWNLYRCTHGIHIDIQHGKPGWEGLFNGFEYQGRHYAAPWLKGRCERARRLYDLGIQLSRKGYSNDEVISFLSDKDTDFSSILNRRIK